MISFLLLFTLFIPKITLGAQVIEIEDKLHYQVSPRFLSLAMDVAQVAGGKWWEGSKTAIAGRGNIKSTPFNFKRSKLIELTKELAPFYLRLGGSEADFLLYAMNNNTPEELPAGIESVLTADIWDNFYDFTKITGGEVVFTINAGFYPREKILGGVIPMRWSRDHLEVFLAYLKKKNQKVRYFDLGNEVNSFWLTHGIKHYMTTSGYVKDYLKAKAVLKKYDKDAHLMGPANAVWPILGESIGLGSIDSKSFLKALKDIDILSWHYYPTQSSRCPVYISRADKKNLLSVKTRNESQKQMSKLRSYIDKYSPKTKLWLGETSSALCGGEKGISDSKISSLWWLDHLGLAALTKHAVVIRQIFAGSDYGLIDGDTLKPRADYFASLKWKEFMGEVVLKTKTNGELISYAHCHPEDGVSLLLINKTEKSHKVSVNNSIVEVSPESYLFKKLDLDFKACGK